MGKCKGIQKNGKPCVKDGSYGYVGGKRDHCVEHKATGMKNLKGYFCATCGKRANYGYDKSDTNKYCAQCKEDDMDNVLKKKCITCNKVLPSYNYKGMKKPLYCVSCALPGMENITDKKCIVCNKITASFGYIDGKKEYCANDKLLNMIDLTKSKCIICGIIAQFNFPNETKGLYCSKHKLKNMEDLFNPKCKTCGKFASYGFINGKKEYCSKCKQFGMINIYGKKCLGKNDEKCDTDPSFGIPGGKATHCVKCKDLTMIDLKHKMCETCNKLIATFNFKDTKIPKYCKTHAEIGMIDITAIRCTECTTTATFGIPGNQSSKCVNHKITNMITNPRTRCVINKCDEIALYGLNKQIHCEDHKKPNEYNLVDRECKSCKLAMILNKDDLCGFCDPTMIKNTRLMKQKEIKSLLDAKKYKYTLYDKIIDSKCGLSRPDFLFDCITYCVILEVDENQHIKYNNQQTGTNYDCETVRMFNIFQTIGMKTIFIRYNPDDYKVNGIKQNITKNKRHGMLLKCLNTMMKQNPEKLDHLSVAYIYYDDFDEKNIELQKIDLLYK